MEKMKIIYCANCIHCNKEIKNFNEAIFIEEMVSIYEDTKVKRFSCKEHYND